MYVVIVGSSDQDEVSMYRFEDATYVDDADAIREVRAEVNRLIRDEYNEVGDDNVSDRLESVGELTINMYDGYGETLYKIFEV